MEQKISRRKFDKETVFFMLFFLFMVFYYGWRMFALTPWYDELYTYYYFISRGPVYAAIHWPLPNNHIGYSVLSACLGIFGNPAIALRGISYLASLGSLVLIFRISRKCFMRGMALVPVFLFVGMRMVNQLAVQGRGYALVTFCYLISLWELLHISVEHRERGRDYLIFGLSLVLALYAIPSSIYVVIPVCLVGGISLLIQREWRSLIRLILTSVVSAVCTVGLYGVVWLAIGSNLLVKTEGSAWYGMGHASAILHAPFEALRTGIEYMLATPYIQSVGREEFTGKFAAWLRSLLNEYYIGGSIILMIVLIVCVVAAVYRFVRKWKNHSDSDYERHEQFVEIYLAVSIILLPLMLIVQNALPYYRVFSFAGIVVAFAMSWLLSLLTAYLQQKLQKMDRFSGKDMRLRNTFPTITCVFAFVLCMVLLFSGAYMAQYSEREAAIEDACEHVEWTEVEKAAVTDCDQEYLLLFLYGFDEGKIAGQYEEADVIFADKHLLLGQESESIDYSSDVWKLYTTGEEFRQFLENADMEAFYENERFVVYR